MNPVSISYIMPVYDEEPIIRTTLDELIRSFEDLSDVVETYEIIVVDDGSRDGTPAIAEEFASRHANVRLLRHERNGGAGKAILTGFKEARMEWVSANFADLPFKTSDIRKLAPFFQDNDLIVVCRNDRGANHWYRKLTSYGNYALIRLLFWSGIHDFQFVQFYRRSLLTQMNIVSQGTLVTPEMILRCQKAGARISEVFLPFRKRPGGRAKYGHPKHIFITLMEMIRLRLRFWKEAYVNDKSGSREVASRN